MPRPFHLALALCLTLPAAAQQIEDPANLMGERVSPPSLADTLPINHGAPALEQLLRKLRTRASMMLIVAHPDDEDSGLLTLESRGMGARVAMLTLNRGEGGQNLMSADFNDALGLIRTQELLAEDRFTGVDQLFGTEVDFGFSKTKEEAFAKWGHDRVLYDAVRAVRLYRPLVLASVFIGGVTDGHGQHQVAGEIAQEVFLAAADPKVFPEMGLPPWAPLRVYARVPFAPITDKGMFDYATGKWLPPHFHNYVIGADTSTPPASTVTIHEGDKPNIPAFNGMSYVQWARQGLALQKSQIGPNFRIPPAGAFDVGYTLMGSRIGCPARTSSSSTSAPKPLGTPSLQARVSQSSFMDGALAPGACLPSTSTEPDLFSGIDTTLPALADLAPSAPTKLRGVLGVIDLQTAEAQKLFDSARPELTAPPLARALKLVEDLIRDTEASNLPQQEKFNLLHELRIKRVQINDALALALGLRLEASLASLPSWPLVESNERILTIQPAVVVHGSFTNGNIPLTNVSVTLSLPSNPQLAVAHTPKINPHQSVTLSSETPVKSDLPATRPYFFRNDIEQPFYEVLKPALRNSPATPNPIVETATANYDGVRIESKTTVAAAEPDKNVRSPALVIPPITVALDPHLELITPTDKNVKFRTSIESRYPVESDSGTVCVVIPPGAHLNPPSAQWAASMSGHAEPILFTYTPPKTANSFSLKAIASRSGHDYTESFRAVGYPGLTYTNYYTPATFKAVPVDVTTAPNLRIAYLPGTGDEVPAYLPSVGVTPTILTTKDLTPENLKQYDAILLGVRAYSAHPELEGAGSQSLNDYAKQGGVVIAQYNGGGFNPASAPYPYTLPGDHAYDVVEEEQPVTILQPTNPLLTWPNRITPADFEHWIEERGHGFASNWAHEYTPLLEMHDVGQDPQKGGLLVAKVGRGAYIYCALALYRQLPEGVPGAYRLVANLLSYAKNPHR